MSATLTVRAPRLGFARLIDGHELLPAAAVSAHGVHHEAGSLGQIPGIHQRPGQRDHAGGVAPRVGDALGAGHLLLLLGVELGEAVRPAFRDPVRGGGVDDDGVWIGAHRDRLDRRVVGEAEDGGVRGVEKLGALGGILAIVAGERDDLDIVAAGEPVADLEAGGARLSVDKDLLLGAARIDAVDAGPGRCRGPPARLESRAGRAQDRGCAEGECGHDELAGLDRRVPIGVRGAPFQQHVFRFLLSSPALTFAGEERTWRPPPHPSRA